MRLKSSGPKRTSTAADRHLCKVMVLLGWSPVRVRDFTRNGYRAGYVRDAGAVR
jgi:hypothetical protein